MNERIRELQSKSYLMCKQIVDDDGHVVVTPDQWFDKFAELLVEECAELMETQHTWITSVAASTLIRNHFKNEKF